ncbi:MAG: hypothetical protein JW724_07630 [Candidatus Altiarchaeota archaeon]|nr:hypothetical protein [Candidatus Altiarchaeota archaeon]
MADERGSTETAFRLVLAVTIAAAAIIILLQMMHVEQDTLQNTTVTVDSGARKALDETMKTLSD